MATVAWIALGALVLLGEWRYLQARTSSRLTLLGAQDQKRSALGATIVWTPEAIASANRAKQQRLTRLSQERETQAREVEQLRREYAALAEEDDQFQCAS